MSQHDPGQPAGGKPAGAQPAGVNQPGVAGAPGNPPSGSGAPGQSVPQTQPFEGPQGYAGQVPAYGGSPQHPYPNAPYPQANVPGGYGVRPQAAGPFGPPLDPAQPPSKNNRLLVIAGIGCGLFLLLGIAAVVAGVLWLRSRGNAAVEELQRLQASASAMVAGTPVPAGSPAASTELTGDCLLAYRCCLTIATKSPSGSAAAQACEVFKTPAYPVGICSGALVGYRKVAEQTGVKCD